MRRAAVLLTATLVFGAPGPAFADHDWGGGDQDYDQNYGSEDDRNHNRRNRGAFSPGPFRDSPVDAFNNVCMPGATCHYDGQRGEQQPPKEAT